MRFLLSNWLRALLALALVATAAQATEPSAEARRLTRQGRCEEALPLLAAARAAEPRDADLALLDGQCRIRQRDYAGAAVSLGEAEALDPRLRDVALYRGVALYHVEDFAGAEASLETARGNVSDTGLADLELYTGLLLLRRSQLREGALALGRARAADASQVEPVASYYEALAWQSVNERELAREALERVKAVDGDGVWARRAEIALSGRELEDRNWVSLTAGLEYDSNVVLRADGVPLATDISGESDGRGVWFLEAGAELFRSERFSGGLLASYAGSAHFDLNEFDTHFPTASLWLDFDVDNQTLLRARYGAGYAWVDYEPFVTSQNASLSVFRGWGEPGETEFFVGWNWADYHFDLPFVPQGTGAAGSLCPGVTLPVPPSTLPCSPPGIDTMSALDRDGNGLRTGFEHRYDVDTRGWRGLRDLVLRGGYVYELYRAHGTEYDYQGHQLGLGFEAGLPWRLELDVSAAFIYRPFEHPSVFPTPPVVAGRQYLLRSEDRRDLVYQAGVELERPITSWLDGSVRYQYLRNDSNAVVFDYRRHVVGGYLIVRF
jgi:tetratricopeptide (TPR) repeat protein